MLGNANDIVGIKSSAEHARLTVDGKLKSNPALQARSNERRWAPHDFKTTIATTVCQHRLLCWKHSLEHRCTCDLTKAFNIHACNLLRPSLECCPWRKAPTQGEATPRQPADPSSSAASCILSFNGMHHASSSLHRQIENELRRLLGSTRCSALDGKRAELEAAAARYALSDAMLSLAEAAAPDDEDLAYQMAVGECFICFDAAD